MEQRSNSHELFGYDYMVDDKFKVWLIEVNSSPDFSYSTVLNNKISLACNRKISERGFRRFN